jgi:tRNA threonylcarbamoyladenosine biosynthesis protein TsaB
MNKGMQQNVTLVIDGSGGGVFAGILDGQDRWLAQAQRSGTALENLFPVIEATLKAADLHFYDLSGYHYCEGPGSVLGLRLCAMAIETWRRLYPTPTQLHKYNSLQLCALSLLLDTPEIKDALVVADWKKGAWNALKISNGQTGSTEVLDDAALTAWQGALYHLPQRKGWQSPPAGAQTLNYEPARISDLRGHPSLLQATEEVELYNTGINTFQKWTPDRHRA